MLHFRLMLLQSCSEGETMIKPRVMGFVDGENLVMRYQEMSKSRPSYEHVVHMQDRYVWCKDFPTDRDFEWIVINYYASIVGDEQLIDTLEQQIKNIRTDCFNPIGFCPLRPHLFKKANNTRSSKGVDIKLAVDVLSNVYNNNINIVYLFSGDGDFVPMIKEVQRMGKYVVLGAFSNGLNTKLLRVVDDFKRLDEYFFKE